MLTLALHSAVLWLFGNTGNFLLTGMVLGFLVMLVVVALDWRSEHSAYPIGKRLGSLIGAWYAPSTTEEHSRAGYRSVRALIQKQDATGKLLIGILEFLMLLCAVWLVFAMEAIWEWARSL